jgi:hypothetical protein
MSNYSSIYIPRMFYEHTEESVRRVMEYFRIGTVERVDFTPINKQPGFGENVDQVVKSAFVHFVPHLFSTVTIGEQEEFWTHIDNGDSRKLQVNSREYWICLKNKNPVQRTMMNIHQVVENAHHLEKTIEEQASTIKKLEEKVEGVRQVVYQLLGGLYSHKTQSGTLHSYCDVLFAENPECYEKDTSIWTEYPTTRQGDSNEERIEKLEEQLKYMFSRGDDTCSTHSSMPDLIEDFSEA